MKVWVGGACDRLRLLLSKYIRSAQSEFSCYNVTEPPIDAPRYPLYKTERDVFKVYLTKQYRNRHLENPNFVLDFEEIYVIDSKTKSISRAKVVENKGYLLHDNGSGFNKETQKQV